MRVPGLAVAFSIALGSAGAAAQQRDARPPQPETPARTRLPPAPDAKRVEWNRHIEIGGDFAFVQRAASEDAKGKPSDVRYEPAVGFGLHARWQIFKYLRFGAYFIDADHDVTIPEGASLGAALAGARLQRIDVHTFSFGARLAPTLPLSDRARAWLGIGVGWGRLEFDRMEVTKPTGAFLVRERADPFVEFPLGIGASFDIIPRWLSVEVELSGAFVDDQAGDALGEAQAIDGEGRKVNVGGFPAIDATFVQTVGLSLIL